MTTTDFGLNNVMNGNGTSNNVKSSEQMHPLKEAQKGEGLMDVLPSAKREGVKTVGVLQTPESNVKSGSDSVVSPAPIPHVEINQVSLSLIIRNLTVFTVKEISQYMKTNEHINPQEPSSARKLRFLQLIIFMRNQFLKLYVLIKWCRTIKNNNFNTMIDLLNWFRITNAQVNNCIWALKSNVTAMSNAKLPNADLVTALEVLSLGRTNLPVHNFRMSGEEDPEAVAGGMKKIPPKLVLRRLRDLNLAVSLKIALIDFPPQFQNYVIKNGRIYITVAEEFEIQLATIDCHSPLFFVDLKFLFTDRSLPLHRLRTEKVINELLFKSPKPLVALHNFLHKYVLTLQLYMIHTELLDMESSGKFTGGNLVHRYDSKKSIISIKYWIHSKLGQKAKIKIGVEKSTESLVLKWDNPMASQSRMPVIYNNILKNLESTLDEIMFNHSCLIRADLLAKGVFQEDEESPDVLLFQVPTTCFSVAPIQLKIDLSTGVFYFKNPTALLLKYVSHINRAENAEELTKVLHRLKLEKISHILKSMFEKTGWTCSKVIKLDNPIESQTVSKNSADTLLQDDIFIRLPNWLANWYLILTVLSSNTSCIVEKRIGKVASVKGKWQLIYLGKSTVTTSRLETMTYQKVLHLQKTIFHRVVNHMVIDSLNQLNIRNKICSNDLAASSLPPYIADDTVSTNGGECYTSIITLELESFLGGSKALNSILESSMFMKIDYSRSEIKLFGKFKHDTTMIKCKCDELLIHFVPGDSLAFYICEDLKNLNLIVQYLAKFKQKLMQMVVLTDVVERLHKNFASEGFKIIALKPNEISFKYLKDSTDNQDCTISITTSDQTVESMTVRLSPSNPQHIIQPFIDRGHMDYHSIFNYLQFTSSLFVVLKTILSENQNTSSYTMVSLGLHNLCEYQLLYHNPESGTKITVIVELKNVSHNRRKKIQFYIHFSDEEHISTKSMAYPLVHQVRNQVFMLDTRDNTSGDNSPATRKYPHAIKLVDGISCDPPDVGPILLEIHNILKTDSNVTVPAPALNGISSTNPTTVQATATTL